VHLSRFLSREITFNMKKILLLGSGELGKEFVIAALRMGQYVVAVDSYPNAPAMQVAQESEVINMLDGEALDTIVKKHQPDIIVPEIEAIRTEKLYNYEAQGIQIVPSAKAANFTMNRKAIRDLAAKDLGVRTAKYQYATSLDALKNLEILSITQTKATAEGISGLTKLKNLKKVYLYKTSFTNAAIAQLKQKMPGLRIDTGGYKVPILVTDTTEAKAPEIKTN
jgi:phosphoglycerate dehydrogenase-like enzyme